MDVNGTRFHLVLTESEWLAPTSVPHASGTVEWKDGAVALLAEAPRFAARRGELPLDPARRRGAARDRYGNWYTIGADARELQVLWNGRRTPERYWPAAATPRATRPGAFGVAASPEPAERTLAGVVVTRDHYLVAGYTMDARPGAGGLLVFDLHGGGAPLELPWPAPVPFTPFDMVAASDGGLWVLDRDARALWRLDRWLRVVRPVARADDVATFSDAVRGGFMPVTKRGVPMQVPECEVRHVSWRDARPLADLAWPVAVEALPDGSALVLDQAPFAASGALVRFDAAHAMIRQRMREPAYDIAFVATPVQERRVTSGTLFVVGPAGNQGVAFDLRVAFDSGVGGEALTLQPRTDYLPMRRFGGTGLVSDGVARAYYDSEGRWLPLVEQPNPRFATRGDMRLPSDGGAFDGREPRCVWHRLDVDGCIPADARLVVRARASDDEALLVATPWQDQPVPYRRADGAELPYYEPAVGSGNRHGTWELLFQNVTGRFMQLELTLHGNGRVTPRLQALRIHYPRFSYLREYLPAAYREDAASASFLDRWLANVEGIYTTIEGRIAGAQSLFDVRTVPARYLEWLAGWMGATLDLGWSERTKRLFIAHAPQYFRERGTCAGMLRALRLALQPAPDERVFADAPCGGGAAPTGFGVRVVERFRTRRAPGVVFGDPTDLLGPGSTSDASDWTPARGAEPLHAGWRASLAARYTRIAALNDAWGTRFSAFTDPAIRLSAVRPAAAAERADWLRFVQRDIGFTWAVATARDEPLYREFLARRYGQPADVNAAYGLAGDSALGSFADVRARLWDGVLAHTLPAGGAWLADWVRFVSTVLPLERTAHRFVVLVPVAPGDLPDEQRRRRDVAERVARLEKPAHAAVEVRLYWGMFRAGEARVGADTVLGPGARSVALVLGRGTVGGAHLGFDDVARDRLAVGHEWPGPTTATATACCTTAPCASDPRG